MDKSRGLGLRDVSFDSRASLPLGPVLNPEAPDGSMGPFSAHAKAPVASNSTDPTREFGSRGARLPHHTFNPSNSFHFISGITINHHASLAQLSVVKCKPDGVRRKDSPMNTNSGETHGWAGRGLV